MYILFVQIHYSSWYWQFEAFANAASQPFWRAFKCKSESSLKVGVQFAQPQGGWSLEAVLAGRKHINGDGLVMRTLTHSIHTLTTLIYNITKEKIDHSPEGSPPGRRRLRRENSQQTLPTYYLR